MIIVSDTTPLRYLIEVEAIGILPRLFGRVMTTPTIVAELRQAHFPSAVRQWADRLPDWMEIATPRQTLPVTDVIDAGEAEAIALAMERKADRLLIDENAGVELARSLHVPVLRTLTLIAVAGELGYLPLAQTLTRLANETQFRATRELFDRFLNQDAVLRELVRKEAEEIVRLQKQSEPPFQP